MVVDLGAGYTNVPGREQVYSDLKVGEQSEKWGVYNLLQTGHVSKFWRSIPTVNCMCEQLGWRHLRHWRFQKNGSEGHLPLYQIYVCSSMP